MKNYWLVLYLVYNLFCANLYFVFFLASETILFQIFNAGAVIVFLFFLGVGVVTAIERFVRIRVGVEISEMKTEIKLTVGKGSEWKIVNNHQNEK